MSRAKYDVYWNSVMQWYTRARWDEIYPFISGEACSRRLLEHLVTDYSRARACEYPLKDPESGETVVFNIHHAAQTVLAGNHKAFMDPFGRKRKGAKNGGIFAFGWGDKTCSVSVSELVFFRWAYKHKVLDYARDNAEAIKADMALMAKVRRQGKRERPTIEEVVIELPDPASTPLRDKYWLESTYERKITPRPQRKRARKSGVAMVVNNQCIVTNLFGAKTESK